MSPVTWGARGTRLPGESRRGDQKRCLAASIRGAPGLGQLRVQTDIKNIAGATLSTEHVTAGVRWLVALWQVALRPRPLPPVELPCSTVPCVALK